MLYIKIVLDKINKLLGLLLTLHRNISGEKPHGGVGATITKIRIAVSVTNKPAAVLNTALLC